MNGFMPPFPGNYPVPPQMMYPYGQFSAPPFPAPGVAPGFGFPPIPNGAPVPAPVFPPQSAAPELSNGANNVEQVRNNLEKTSIDAKNPKKTTRTRRGRRGGNNQGEKSSSGSNAKKSEKVGNNVAQKSS